MTFPTAQRPAEAASGTSELPDELCVIGHPSRLGGADTELDHQIDCWLAMGIQVHICHTAALDANLESMALRDRGCIYHEPRDWRSLEGLHCISFCNAEFLNNLPQIRRYARTTTFVNCMTFNFAREIEMHQRGLIDFHLYQTPHARDQVAPALASTGRFRPLMFTPYFRADQFPFHEARPSDKFRFGRISRNDADKFDAQQLWIYETMTAPQLKEGLIVGWNEVIERKFGRRPDSWIRTCPAGSVSQHKFYEFCEAVIMSTATLENLPRVGFEAMASGSILIVDDRGGWKQQVEDGITGWLCHDDREFVYKASRCAFEPRERQAMRVAARERLEAKWGIRVAMESWATVFRELQQLGRHSRRPTVSPSAVAP